MSTELKVGALVVVAIAVAGGFILNMQDTAGFFGSPTDVYRVRVEFASVAGLSEDAIVRLKREFVAGITKLPVAVN